MGLSSFIFLMAVNFAQVHDVKRGLPPRPATVDSRRIRNAAPASHHGSFNGHFAKKRVGPWA